MSIKVAGVEQANQNLYPRPTRKPQAQKEASQGVRVCCSPPLLLDFDKSVILEPVEAR